MSEYDSFVNEMIARLTGPLGFRFILQPLMAILLGFKDGVKDAHFKLPPYVMHFITHPEKRWSLLKDATISALKPIILGIITDAIAQYLIYHTVHPLQAVFVGCAVIAIPYVFTRGITNRIITFRKLSRQ